MAVVLTHCDSADRALRVGDSRRQYAQCADQFVLVSDFQVPAVGVLLIDLLIRAFLLDHKNGGSEFEHPVPFGATEQGKVTPAPAQCLANGLEARSHTNAPKIFMPIFELPWCCRVRVR